ncbi:PREDICTED: FOG Transposon-encoded s with TYA reverse mRNAase, partial [Prunus dulcis]
MEIPTLHTFVADSCKNDELLSRDLDPAEEFRDRALARLKNYQMKVKRSYDKKVRKLQVDDLVWRKRGGWWAGLG